MTSTRMSTNMRSRIAKIIEEATFEERTKDYRNEDAILFRLVAEDIYGKDDLKKIAKLPPHWFRRDRHVSANAGGFRYLAHVEENQAICVPYMVLDNVTHDLKSPDLIMRVQTHMRKVDTISEERETVYKAVYSLLRSCNTLEQFYVAMPDAKAIVGDKFAVATPSQALTVTGDQVMCLIAKARGEAREGCCEDGTVIKPALAPI
jgi:hypothetical protein